MSDTNKKTDFFLKKYTRSRGFKAFLIAILVLLFLIPLSFVKYIVYDRKVFSNNAEASIVEPLGGQMVLEGLSLCIEYQYSVIVKDKADKDQTIIKKDYLIVSPSNYKLNIKATTKNLTRGIFSVPTYNGSIDISADFELPRSELVSYDKDGILQNKIILALGLSNTKNIMSLPNFIIDKKNLLPTEVKFNFSGLYTNSIQYDIPIALQKNTKININGVLNFQGGKTFSIMPLGGDNSFVLTSDWKTPSFTGGWLPTTRDITNNGFKAEWQIAGVSTNIDAVMDFVNFSNKNFARDDKNLVTTEFFMPINGYQKTERSIKYALLFLLVPFLTIFLCEIFIQIRIHPVQYCLIGLANVIFYLLLLSISEHISFNSSFLISSAAVTILTAIYIGSIFKNIKLAGVVAMVQIVSYVFLFGTLQAEDYALLIGTLGLFIVIATLMFMTRKIDWYDKTE